MKSPFRSIRQTLFTEGKLLRYLGYAVGEVLLIIVGILLSLKIYDWNEDKKAQAEFELYVVQLREDVGEAMKNLEESSRVLKLQQERIEYIPVFLELPECSAEDLVKFEEGLNALGGYSEASIHVGLLGELMDGNKEVIGRDPILAKEFLEIEGLIERHLGNLDHIYNQIDLYASRMNQFRGKGRVVTGLAPKYDLEQLESSYEFIYTSHSNASLLGSASLWCERIAESLQDFLATLEEYE